MKALENWKVTDNAELRGFMGRIYNNWFVKWRDLAAAMSDAEWSACMDEGDAILNGSSGGTLEHRIAALLMWELAARRQEGGAA